MPKECVPGLSSFAFLGLISLDSNTLKILFYIGSKFWPEFFICAISFSPHSKSQNSSLFIYSERADATTSVQGFSASTMSNEYGNANT